MRSMLLNLRDRPAAQYGYLLAALLLWAVVYALWVHFLSALSVEGEAWRRIVFAFQSTVYVVFPVLILLPLAVVPAAGSVRIAGLALFVLMMAVHLTWPPESLGSHLFRDLSLITLAVILGGLLGWGIAENRHIIPAFVVLFVLDVWSVFFGLSGMISRSPEVTRHVLVGSPVIGYPAPQLPLIRPLLGPADVLILVACVAMTMKFQLGLVRSLAYLGGGLLMGFLFVAFLGRPAPMLPFLVSAFVVGHHQSLSLDRRQILLAVVFAVAVVSVLTVIGLTSRMARSS